MPQSSFVALECGFLVCLVRLLSKHTTALHTHLSSAPAASVLKQETGIQTMFPPITLSKGGGVILMGGRGVVDNDTNSLFVPRRHLLVVVEPSHCLRHPYSSSVVEPKHAKLNNPFNCISTEESSQATKRIHESKHPFCITRMSKRHTTPKVDGDSSHFEFQGPMIGFGHFQKDIIMHFGLSLRSTTTTKQKVVQGLIIVSYLPMQKSENRTSKTSSTSTAPVIRPSSEEANRNSSAAMSTAMVPCVLNDTNRSKASEAASTCCR